MKVVVHATCSASVIAKLEIFISSTCCLLIYTYKAGLYQSSSGFYALFGIPTKKLVLTSEHFSMLHKSPILEVFSAQCSIGIRLADAFLVTLFV